MFRGLARIAQQTSGRSSSLFTQMGVRESTRSTETVRNLNIHEYQAKGLMERYGVTIQRFGVADTAEEAKQVADKLNVPQVVVKAQVHAGGRGKGYFKETGYKGGVHLSDSSENAQSKAAEMLGKTLVTKQTGEAGVPVRKVMICESIDFQRELYFSLVLDREHNGPVIVASPMGGMDIEKVAEESPEQIFKLPISPLSDGPTDNELSDLSAKLGFSNQQIPDAVKQMRSLYDMFMKSDCTMVEVNPLVETTNGKVYAVDAKIGFDDNASFRQEEIFSWRDPTEEDPREVEASKYNLNYVGMDGNIGCMVNGAGLAMATMDIIKLHGGEPANFLDAGGGANQQQVTEAFKIISSDPEVKVLLVNIFGGIVRCDVISEGIIAACKEIGLRLPLVVRLEGTNAELGLKLLEESGLNVTTAGDLEEAAAKAVAALPK